MKPWYVDQHAGDKPHEGLLLEDLKFASCLFDRPVDKLKESILSENASAVQNLPTTSERSVDVLDSLRDIMPADVFVELSARVELGVRKYGSRLKTDNGRDVAVDCRQEILDTIMYSQQGYLQSEPGSLAAEKFRVIRSNSVTNLLTLDSLA